MIETHIADLPILPLSCISVQLKRSLVYRFSYRVHDQITNGRLFHRVRILFATQLVQCGLSLLLVPEDAEKVTLIRQEKFDGDIPEQERSFVCFHNLGIRPASENLSHAQQTRSVK